MKKLKVKFTAKDTCTKEFLWLSPEVKTGKNSSGLIVGIYKSKLKEI